MQMTLQQAAEHMGSQRATDEGQAVLDAIERAQAGLRFIQDLASEAMSNGDVRVGTAAEIVVRHICRRASELLA